VHKLIAITFMDCKDDSLVVDHINNVRTDNRLENLQLISIRENVTKDRGGTSKYTGVSYYRNSNKWRSQIRIGKQRKHIGFYRTELGAYLAYVNQLELLKTKDNG
jgi:hypothetical protein